MILKVRKIGNSVGVLLPKGTAELGDEVDVRKLLPGEILKSDHDTTPPDTEAIRRVVKEELAKVNK